MDDKDVSEVKILPYNKPEIRGRVRPAARCWLPGCRGLRLRVLLSAATKGLTGVSTRPPAALPAVGA